MERERTFADLYEEPGATEAIGYDAEEVDANVVVFPSGLRIEQKDGAEEVSGPREVVEQYMRWKNGSGPRKRRSRFMSRAPGWGA